VVSLAQEPDRTIWIGSTSVHRFDPSSGGAISLATLPRSNTIDIVPDSNQTLWIAKEHAGVFKKQENTWEEFTTRDGLASVRLSDLLLLKDGTLLASSGSGISRFDGKTWTTMAYPEGWTMSRRTSGMRESTDGSIWFNFATEETRTAQILLNRTEKFFTIRHRAEKAPPDTHITDYLEEVAPPGNSHIKWTACDPWRSTSLQELQYSWKLDDGSWSPFSDEKSRTFLKLASGSHTLEVRARDRAFNMDPTPDRIEFAVIAPVWKQPWFISMTSFFSGLILFLTWILIRNREKHLMERQVEREQHLLEIDRLKTGFFTNISHELRTPVTVILGRVEMMLERTGNEEDKKILSTMAHNARRMAVLVTQLLDFRKIEENKISVNSTQGDAVPVIRDLVSSLMPLAENEQISLRIESIDSCPGWFDFDKLQKIITNLISNSIKYTKAGGEVSLRVEMKQDKENNRQMRLIVEDTGIGISQKHLHHIFDRFYRVSEASMASGAGIGLNLTKELVELLDGNIQAESPIHSNPDRPGTRFTVGLPINAPAGTEKSSDSAIIQEPIKHSLQNEPKEEMPTILVVEDDQDIREFITDGLKTTYKITTADNGETGLQIAKKEIPDLIVTDVMMPVKDGISMCSELKSGIETSHIPVIMLTAKSSFESQMEGLQTGADDYITKPFHMALLQTRINNLLESRRKLREQFCREYPILTPSASKHAPDKEFTKRILKILEENYTDWEFGPNSLATSLGMSLSTLHRKLKAVTDRTPAGFIHEFRMAQAAKILIDTSCTISEVAFRVGYEEPSNFSRTFKTYYKTSPSKYRATHQPN